MLIKYTFGSKSQTLRMRYPFQSTGRPISHRNCWISYREGLGTSPCIMGLTTQDPYIQKEHTGLYKILKFRVNWANIEQNTAIQKLQNLVTNVWIAGHLSGNPYISLQILKFLNGYILFNIGPIDFLMVILASGIALGRVRTTTTTTESRNKAAIIQIIGFQRHTALVCRVL